MNMKRILAALVAGLMTLSLAACGNSASNSNNDASKNPIKSFSASYGETMDDTVYVNIFPAETEGKFMLDYTSADKMERGTIDESLLNTLTELYAKSDLASLNEKNEYGDGDASASMSLEFADGSMFSCAFGGEIPEQFVTGYKAMDEAILSAMETMEPYRAEVPFDEAVNADAKAELEALFAHLSNQALENTMATNLPSDDENYIYSAGIEANADIASTTVVQNMMGTIPHSMILFQLNDGADAAALQNTLMEKADWRKWVCVSPDVALTASKGNNVLFVMTLSDINAELTPALEAEGWTINATAENPDLAM